MERPRGLLAACRARRARAAGGSEVQGGIVPLWQQCGGCEANFTRGLGVCGPGRVLPPAPCGARLWGFAALPPCHCPAGAAALRGDIGGSARGHLAAVPPGSPPLGGQRQPRESNGWPLWSEETDGIRARRRGGGGAGNWSCSHDWGAAARRWDRSECMKVAHRAGALTPAGPAQGFGPVWDMVLPGQRWPPVHRRGPPVLMLPTRIEMRGQTSSWAPGCRIQISNLDSKPACPGVSGFRLIPGLAGVKNGGGGGTHGLGAGRLRAGL